MNTRKLKYVYAFLLLPALFGFAGTFLTRQRFGLCLPTDGGQDVVVVLLFIMTAVSALAAPILYRTCFAHRHRHRISVPAAVLFRFERNLIGIAMTAPYLALCAYVLQVPRFHLSGILLMAMYAVYYTYPSNRRIRMEQKWFREDPSNGLAESAADMLPRGCIGAGKKMSEG